ncbi:MFS transporter [Calidifontibacter sp. DB0510]|uniref:MFS transporter n=1 Tax=Metallococcus carri TaxID=1656884 RepID=A0A967EFU6_9MICO|nr:MFS transporter [Metallococcus carri]NHN54318.1 MFS transporter [Metallococcus carri]NOP36842.1 MFS transporter [Calidifontibacter sp. DB2511S]
MTIDREQLQRRTVRTLVASQVCGGVGVASGIAVMALLALRLSGSETLSGLGTTAQVLGGALITVPVAALSARRGRRAGLSLGYALAVLGAIVIVLAAAARSFPLMLLGALLFGGATTANSQARYAGADLASAQHRGRDLSLVVWAATIGSVLGPNLVGPGESVGRALHLPRLTGSFVLATLGFVLALVVLTLLLRPDPLLAARELDRDPAGTTAPAADGSLRTGIRAVLSDRRALCGMLTTALGHAVMISVMVMTPLHMDHGGASLRLIGLVISGHILGMYAFSPVTGWLVDRFGGPVVALGAAAILLSGGLLAATTQEGMSARLAVALFLVGVGWSGTLVSGSTMLTNAIPLAKRPAAQGFADLAMGLAGAAAGAGAGAILQHSGFAMLGYLGAVIAICIAVAVLVLGRTPRPST